MCMNDRRAPRQAGLSLVELIVFIVIVGVGVAGILAVMNVTIKSSADPMVRKQALALADSVLAEILLKEYDDPDGVSGETTRATFDDVDDFDPVDDTNYATYFTDTPSGYTIDIVVAAAASVSGVNMKKVTVTVAKGAESIAMVGYRADY